MFHLIFDGKFTVLPRFFTCPVFFSGSTFEGHTLIPVIKSFIKKNKEERFTVVADEAMISTENVAALRAEKINGKKKR